MHDDMDRRHRAKSRWVLCGFLVIVGFFLFEEHRAHLLGALPYLLLLACPLMHLFMHHDHAVHGGQKHDHDASEGDTK